MREFTLGAIHNRLRGVYGDYRNYSLCATIVYSGVRGLCVA